MSAAIDVTDVRGPVALRLKPAESGWEALARQALFFLIRNWQTHFQETVHVLPFPPEQGFRSPEPMHSGDTFARAIIADAFCDADPLVEGQLARLIDAEIAEILAQRRMHGVGGWSYFPTVIELPPDADDLAQVITLLARTRRWSDLRELCMVPLQVLLRDCAHEDGSFETWIIPATDRSDEEQLQAEWVAKAWGSGADVEVVANVIHALGLLGSGFAREIERGIEFLRSRQERDGSWSSSWYWGPYYGTYATLRVLDSPVAVSMLTASQRDDGGWGIDGTSDPLSTALALCALSSADALTLPLLERAYSFLQRSALPDGGWQACPFIRMNLGRATGNVHQVLSYGSRCVTSAYVLKAAIATM